MKHLSSAPSAMGSKVSETSSNLSTIFPKISMAGANSAKGFWVSTVVETMAT